MGFWTGKRVFITGGSKGIGRAAAVEAARRGADVWIAARGQGALDEAHAAISEARSGNHGTVSMDVTDDASVAAGVEAVLDGLGGVDVLICNSGAAIIRRIQDLTMDDYQKMIDLNYLGHVRVVTALIPQFQARGSGHIQLVSSMLGFFGQYGNSAYCASKFAIAGYGESLRQDLMLWGVGVSNFFPPSTNTPGLEHENETKPPEVWELESGSGYNTVYEPEAVAVDMLKTIERNKREGVAGLDSAFVLWVTRKVRSAFWWVWDREVYSAIDKTRAKGTDVPVPTR